MAYRFLLLGLILVANVVYPPAAPVAEAGRARSPVAPIAWDAFDQGSPEDAASGRIREILSNANRYTLLTWYPNTFGAQTSTYLDFGGTTQAHIRPPASAGFALAVALATHIHDEEASGVSTDDVAAITTRLVASVARLHRANAAGGWGGSWQSALWADYAGFAGWLVWELLDPNEQTWVAAMVADEADRFVNYPVPYYRDERGRIVSPGDTKAEENAWNGNLLELATAMMPNDPLASVWMNKAIELSLSSFARPSDVSSERVVNGRRLASWLDGSNAEPDGTVVNHGIVQPDYMHTDANNVGAVLRFRLGGKEVPEAALVNGDHVYKALVDLEFSSPPFDPPGGTIYVRDSAEIYYPQGIDWGTSRRMNFVLSDVVADAFGLDVSSSVAAATWERLHAEDALAMQRRFEDGHTYGSLEEDRYPHREQWVAVAASFAYLFKWLSHQGPTRFTSDAFPASPDCTIAGTPDGETLRGTAGTDVICGGSGDDVIVSRGGNDILIGGGGDDRFLPGAGNDLLDGGSGMDTVSYSGFAPARGNTGVTIDLRLSSLQMTGEGFDRVRAFERVNGSAYSDTIRGNNVSNVLWGDGGADSLYGFGGHDRLYGGDGDDSILHGGDGNDSLFGNSGNDDLAGGRGTDRCRQGTGTGTTTGCP